MQNNLPYPFPADSDVSFCKVNKCCVETLLLLLALPLELMENKHHVVHASAGSEA